MPEVWKRNQKTDGRPDGRSDHVIAGTYKIQLLAPVVRGRKVKHQKLFEKAKRSGYVRVQVDGNVYELSEEIQLDKNIKHNIEIVVDRLVVKREGIEKRLTDSIENVMDLAEGLIDRRCDWRRTDSVFPRVFPVPDCGMSIDEIEPTKFFLQQSVWSLPGMFRTWIQNGV